MVHINFTPVCSPASPSVMFVYQTTHPVFNVKLFFYFEGTLLGRYTCGQY